MPSLRKIFVLSGILSSLTFASCTSEPGENFFLQLIILFGLISGLVVGPVIYFTGNKKLGQVLTIIGFSIILFFIIMLVSALQHP